MSIISAIGRKHWTVKGLFVGMYVFLIIGAASMVYPFLLMISGSTYSAVDGRYFTVVPKFLFDDNWLYRKYVEGMFNEDIQMENMVYDDDIVTFERLNLPASVNQAMIASWRAFLETTPAPNYAWMAGFMRTPYSRTMPANLRGLRRYWQRTIGEDIEKVNARMGTRFANWNAVGVPTKSCLSRRDKPSDSKFARSVNVFLNTLPWEQRYYYSVEGFYKRQFLQPQYSDDIAEYNREHGTSYASYKEVHLPRTWAENKTAKEKEDWERFVRETLALAWIRATPDAAPAYREFLKRKYLTIAALNKYYAARYRSFDEVPLIDEPPLSGVALSDWDMFINGWKDPDTKTICRLPANALRIHSVEFMFRDWLKQRYGTLEQVNRQFGAQHRDFIEIGLPQRDMHMAWFMTHKNALKQEFVVRNYIAVAEYILLHGRGVLNTVIYCGLAVLCALLVNPLAAYALSRYKMPSSYKVLLFLMATMAFPPMVTGIQNFLMLKRLGMLNTFAALILPGVANGYSIFLLKGFFDAQPRELYESAALDGASEWTIFWQITMSLSKPILAVIALAAFTAAYSNFMFAFIICQDTRMWTLMVWLYQLQQMSGQGVMYASLIIAAIPTLIIFVFCQNIIMRGIVVPSEK